MAAMAASPTLPPRDDSWLDRVAIAISGICVVHCAASAILLALLASASSVLANPLFHEIGLVVAILLGVVALGRGWRAHRRGLPFALGAAGLATMAFALTLPHAGGVETIVTLIGVGVLALGHRLNLRAAA